MVFIRKQVFRRCCNTAGKAIAGAAKGAAAGPYGMLAAGLWENRKVVGKVLAAIGSSRKACVSCP